MSDKQHHILISKEILASFLNVPEENVRKYLTAGAGMSPMCYLMPDGIHILIPDLNDVSIEIDDYMKQYMLETINDEDVLLAYGVITKEEYKERKRAKRKNKNIGGSKDGKE